VEDEQSISRENTVDSPGGVEVRREEEEVSLLHLAWRLVSFDRTEEGVSRVWRIWTAKYQGFSTCVYSRLRKILKRFARAGATAMCLQKRRLCIARHLYACPSFKHENTTSSTAGHPSSSTTFITMSRILRFSTSLNFMGTETASTKGPTWLRCPSQRERYPVPDCVDFFCDLLLFWIRIVCNKKVDTKCIS
jgi:hypothetical protein